MDESGHLKVYGGGDYVQMALYTLMNSVCNYLECKVTDATDVSKPSVIDDVLQYKLEQAADLIKKHLLRSVREDMETMKGKLTALEMKIYRLEMENMLLLREYVPADILERRMSENAEEMETEAETEAVVDRCPDPIIRPCAFDQQRSIGNHQEMIQESASCGDSNGVLNGKLEQPLAAASFASPASC